MVGRKRQIVENILLLSLLVSSPMLINAAFGLSSI
jgi:hypothetical protein